MRASGIFFCIRIGDFCIVPISVSRRCGHDYAVFRGENRLFFFAVGDSQKQKGLCLLQSAAALEACRALAAACGVCICQTAYPKRQGHHLRCSCLALYGDAWSIEKNMRKHPRQVNRESLH